MDENKKQLSLGERWNLDVEAYEEAFDNNQDLDIFSVTSQCESCLNIIKNNPLRCKKYKDEQKPDHVINIAKECTYYENKEQIEVKISNDDESKFYGALFGFCVGDILGVPLEFLSRKKIKEDPVNELRAYGTHNQAFGTWSDDTSLMICLIDCICEEYSILNLKNNFIKFYKDAEFTPNKKIFDIGNTTKEAIEKMILDIESENCGGSLETDNGNGSLMRVLPLAFYGKNLDHIDLIKLVEEVSSLTHDHKRSKLACIFYVKYLMFLFDRSDKLIALDETINFVKSYCYDEYEDEFKNFANILNKNILEYDEESIKSSGYVIDTLEASLWSFLNGNDYSETVLNAVNLGEDTDTIAAIAGGMAGIYYGYEDIPQNWIQNIVKKEDVYEIFIIFWNFTNKI